MAEWQQLLGEFAAVAAWVPTPLLLPFRQGTWSIVREGDSVVVRSGRCTGFVVEAEMLGVMLDAALRDADAVPDVLMHGADESADLALLPTVLRGRTTWRRGNLQTALWLGADAVPLDLRQGQYAAQLPLARWWQQIRWVAAFAAVALTLQLLLTWMDLQAARSEQVRLRSAIVDSYRQAVPEGALVDAERQLQRQLEQMGGGGQGSAFMPLLAELAAALDAQAGTRLASLNYSNRVGEMRINVVAGGYDEVEQLRAGLQAGGLGAELETSNATGDEVRARLRLRGAP
jgi:general secretion pathway protein L